MTEAIPVYMLQERAYLAQRKEIIKAQARVQGLIRQADNDTKRITTLNREIQWLNQKINGKDGGVDKARIAELEGAYAELTMVAIDMRAAINRLESAPAPGWWDSAIRSAMDETGEAPDD